jgi:uncharacterized repeat protein (TIGR03803 family)
MKMRIKNLLLLPVLIAGLGLIPAGRVMAQTNFSDANWIGLGGLILGQVNALACDGYGNLYVASTDEDYNGFISEWNGYTWSIIAANGNSSVYALVCDSSGNLYAGGEFLGIAGVLANNIAKWNGTTWTNLGSGIGGAVYALAVDKNENLYAGGFFSTAGGVGTTNIAKWNGSTWSALGSGVGAYLPDSPYDVYALACDKIGNLYAGGVFRTAGGVNATDIAKWNGSTWSALGSGLINYIVDALACDTNGNLFAGGDFETAGGSLCIAEWNGSTWSALGTGMNDDVLSLAFDSFGNLYAGGVFSTAGGVSANRIAKWNGSSWSALGSGMSGGDGTGYTDQGANFFGPTVNALAVGGLGSLYAGGNFYEAGTNVAYYVAEALLPVSLMVTTTSLPNGNTGSLYYQSLTAFGGQTPYSWSLFSGSLPSGLSLAVGGLISGTPTVTGTFNFTVKVTDATNGMATQVLTLVLSPSNFKNLYDFTADNINSLGSYTNSDGAYPQAGLVLSGNTLYGTASEDGTSGYGTVFAINTNGTGFTNLYSFKAGNTNSSGAYTNSSGAYPDAGLVLSGNTLYGTAYSGGNSGNGTVFAVNTDGTGFTNLYSFSVIKTNSSGIFTNSDGANPQSGLFLSGNILYGTAPMGGTNGNGTIFAININGTGFTNLHNFSAYGFNSSTGYFTNKDGAYPEGGLILSGNTLYGTDKLGGTNGCGTVFSLNTNGTDFTDLYAFSAGNYDSSVDKFTNSDGDSPNSVILSGNTLFGTAQSGGTYGDGTAFRVNTDGKSFTTLYNFNALLGSYPALSTNSDGAYPQAGLVLSGNTLYGTASEGGTSGYGTVFAINTNGTGFTNLYSLTGSGGANPYAGLVLSGNTLYGTTISGGIYDFWLGTVFSLTLPSVIAPVFQPPKLTNGQFMLTWSAVSNGVYQLQYKTNLTQTNWVNIGSTITASNTVLSATNPINTDNQRFYRVQEQ